MLARLWRTWLLPCLHTIPVASPLLARFGPLDVEPAAQAPGTRVFAGHYRIESSRHHRYAAH
ncbi:hypothetical protein [Streptacidiphilus carbonis]|uniref:hypothetical protein n=1 Tax=Streptacidiphilus carbonis TaxID=105422 RepID=UPI0005AB5121|nr:hypothetical protein [Streptacidiphilus carbonis]